MDPVRANDQQVFFGGFVGLQSQVSVEGFARTYAD